MNLIQTLHQRWAAAAALGDLLPVARVYTGLSADPTIPYAVISKRGQTPATRHHDGSGIDTVAVRIVLFHTSLDQGMAIMAQIISAFDRSRFELDGSDKVLLMQRSNDAQLQQDDGLWQFVIDFQCTVYLESGR